MIAQPTINFQMETGTDGEITTIYGFTFYAADGSELTSREFSTPEAAAAAHDALDDDNLWPAGSIRVSHIWEVQRQFTSFKSLAAKLFPRRNHRNPITGHFTGGDRGGH